MQVTAGIHIDKSGKSYDKVVYHNERKKRIFNDKNININWNLTKYNQVGKLNDADNLLEDNAKSYVKKYNQRQIKNGHKNRCYSSVHQYIQKRGKRAKRRGIIWLGNQRFRTNFENKLTKRLKEINPDFTNQQLKLWIRTKAEPKMIKNTMIQFNKKHKHIKICRYAIHVDENFIHSHVELVAIPSYTNTKNPRPSFSMSKAVREEYPNAKHEYHTKTKYFGKKKSQRKIIHGNFIQADGRKATHQLDDDTGKSLIKNAELIIGNNVDLSLTRTGNASSLSGARYKQYAKESDRAKDEQSKADLMTSQANSAKNNKQSIASDIYDEAQPMINNAISHGQSSANQSASSAITSVSLSASASLSATISSINDSIISSNENWRFRKNTSLSISASHSASASASASVSSTVASINDSIAISDDNWKSSISKSLLTSANNSAAASANGYVSGATTYFSNSAIISASGYASSASDSASIKASNAFSQANSMIDKHNDNIKSKEADIDNFTNFLTDQLAELTGQNPRDPKQRPTLLKKITGQSSIKIDGKKRFGIDLITHVAAWDIMHETRLQNTRNVAYNFKNYQSSSANKYAMSSSEASSYASSIASAQSSRRAEISGSGSEIQ